MTTKTWSTVIGLTLTLAVFLLDGCRTVPMVTPDMAQGDFQRQWVIYSW
jgi:hypothetical protein